MSAKYYTILTETGKTKIANAAALGRQIKLTHLAVGDGDGVEYDPVESQTNLKKETYRTPISHLGNDAQNPNWVIAEGMIPVDVGGWFVREVGLFDEDGDLFAIGKYPETYKPTLAEGTGRDLYIRFIMVVSNTDSIDMKIDPTVGIATREWVNKEATLSVSTIDDLKSKGLQPGTTVRTEGFYRSGDGGAAEYIIVESNTESPSFSITLNDGLFAVMTDQVVSPQQVGYKLDVDELDTTVNVAANWAILKQLLKDLKTSTREMVRFNRVWHPEQIHAEWISGRSAPIGFYSDSTTDGATTTGHTPSVGTTNPFQVVINESPNAYPAKLEQYINDLNKKTTAVRCYNGGFDSQSFANGFGLQQWYNTWFRPAGSNMDFSDVKMIVIGFGTSDSININDTAKVIDDYSIDVECVIVDCFLRNVQPALQTPVMTTQHVGNTVSYRDGDQSITIIEAVQSQLAEKYDLDHFSFYEHWEKALRNFTGYKYRDFMAPDMVHPSNMGHRVHAAYLSTKFCRRYASLEEGQKFTNIFAGHPAFIPVDDSEIVAPDFRGGLILKPIVGTQSNESYYYGWLDSDGNGKSAGDTLIELNVYVEKPCVLYQTAVQNNRKKKNITIESYTLDGTSSGGGNLFDEYQQPETLYHTHKQFITFLTFGMNKIYVNASSDGPDQMIGGFYLVDMDEVPNLVFGRGTGGSTYIEKSVIFPDVCSNYTAWVGIRRNQGNINYYNCFDNHNLNIAFQLTSDFSAGSTYQIFTHYNDLDDFQQGYNLVEITGDDITLKVSTKSGVSTVVTKTVAGLNTKLVYGANIELLFMSKFFADEGAILSILVDGVSLFTHQASLGEIWTDGYGFDAQTFRCKNIRITSRLPFSASIDINRYF
ncbi:phage tail protein [Vibrio cyclitrophicus]